MFENLNRIPRLITLICQWGSCFLLILTYGKNSFRFSKKLTWVLSAVLFAIMAVCLYSYGNSVFRWMFSFYISIALMLIFILTSLKVRTYNLIFLWAKAFLMSEFVAAVVWQFVALVLTDGIPDMIYVVLLSITLLALAFFLLIMIERYFSKSI